MLTYLILTNVLKKLNKLGLETELNIIEIFLLKYKHVSKLLFIFTLNNSYV